MNKEIGASPDLMGINPVQQEIYGVSRAVSEWIEVPIGKIVEIKPGDKNIDSNPSLTLRPMNRNFGAKAQGLLDKTGNAMFIQNKGEKDEEMPVLPTNADLLPIIIAMANGMKKRGLTARERANVRSAKTVLQVIENHTLDGQLLFISQQVGKTLLLDPIEAINMAIIGEAAEIEFDERLDLQAKALLIGCANEFKNERVAFPGKIPDRLTDEEKKEGKKEKWRSWATQVLIPTRHSLERITGRPVSYIEPWKEAIETLPWSKRQAEKAAKRKGVPRHRKSKRGDRKSFIRRSQVGPQIKKKE